MFAVADNPEGSKGFGWGVFRDKATGRRLIAYSTHLWWKTMPLEEQAHFDQMRVNNYLELKARIDALRAKYGNLPVVGGGDLNTTVNVREAGRLTPLANWEADGFCDAQYTVKGASVWSSNHGDPRRDALGNLRGWIQPSASDPKNSLDHVHYSADGIEPISLLVDRAQDALEVSDHSPVVFTFRLAK